ncbi:hypothetical protein FHG87_013759 [Trinorchestia longiramus]|nr:hypothetical protein FHG87_013759 [Trinorchestia longiramus]
MWGSCDVSFSRSASSSSAGTGTAAGAGTGAAAGAGTGAAAGAGTDADAGAGTGAAAGAGTGAAAGAGASTGAAAGAGTGAGAGAGTGAAAGAGTGAAASAGAGGIFSFISLSPSSRTASLLGVFLHTVQCKMELNHNIQCACASHEPPFETATVFHPLTRSSLVPSVLEKTLSWKRLATADSSEEVRLCQCAADAATLASTGPIFKNLMEASLALTAQYQLNCLHMISPRRQPAILPMGRPAQLYVAAQVEKIESFFDFLMEEVEKAMTESALPSYNDEQLTRLMWKTVKDVCKTSIPLA